MGLISFPTNVFCRRPLSISPPFRTKSSYPYNPRLNLKSVLKRQPQRAQVFDDPLLPWSNQAVVQRGLPLRRNRLSPVVSCSSQSTEPRDEDHRAVEAVQKLYTAIKNKNVKEVSDIIGDECRCVCNFISSSPFYGKKQALEFFDHLVKILGDHASINFSLTMHDGMAVGVSWKLEWENNPVPLGAGFNYHVCQEYQGKVVTRNVNMLMDPLIHLGPLRLKIAGMVMLVMDKFGHFALFEDKRKKDIYMFLFLSFTFAILFFLVTASH